MSRRRNKDPEVPSPAPLLRRLGSRLLLWDLGWNPADAPLGPQVRGWVRSVTCFGIAHLWFRKRWLSPVPLDPWSPVMARWALLPFSSEGQRHRTRGHNEGRPPVSAGLRITLTCPSPSPRGASTRVGSDGALRVVSTSGVAARPPGWQRTSKKVRK